MKNGSVPYFAPRKGPPGVMGWLTSTDHKRIGILYLTAILTFFFAAVVLGVLMRIELHEPGADDHEAADLQRPVHPARHHPWSSWWSSPAVPAIFGNFFLPILIGAQDMAFPRLNLFSLVPVHGRRRAGRSSPCSPARARWTPAGPSTCRSACAPR